MPVPELVPEPESELMWEPEPMPDTDYYREDPTAESDYPEDKTTLRDCEKTQDAHGAAGSISAPHPLFSCRQPLTTSLLVLLLR